MSRSRRRGCGVQRTAVTKGESEEEAPAPPPGGGMGRTEMSCMERESMTATLLPAANARRP